MRANDRLKDLDHSIDLVQQAIIDNNRQGKGETQQAKAEALADVYNQLVQQQNEVVARLIK